MKEISDNCQWYVYTLRTHDGMVFYVGKGSGNRILMHERVALALKEISLKTAKIIQEYLSGDTMVRQIEAWFRTEQHAQVYEAMLIEEYSKVVTLSNRVKGITTRILEIDTALDSDMACIEQELNERYSVRSNTSRIRYLEKEVARLRKLIRVYEEKEKEKATEEQEQRKRIKDWCEILGYNEEELLSKLTMSQSDKVRFTQYGSVIAIYAQNQIVRLLNRRCLDYGLPVIGRDDIDWYLKSRKTPL